MSMVEKVARALCRLDGNPENATMDGKPLWQDYLPEARAAIDAMREPDEVMKAAFFATRAEQIRGEKARGEQSLALGGNLRDCWQAGIDAALGKEGS